MWRSGAGWWVVAGFVTLVACGDDDGPADAGRDAAERDAAGSDDAGDAGREDSAAEDDGGADAGPVDPVVETTSGPVRGAVGREGALHFFGIPYAAAPVDALRFRAPAAAEPWTRRSTRASRARHARRFRSPSCRCVARCRRTASIAGFLAHPALDAESDGSRGMYGMLDQQAALRWVRDNAARFGGDASNVTIFGESAGAMSVCLHYVMPGSRGLFARAISQSGSCVGSATSIVAPAAHDAARARGEEIATALGCPGTDAAAAECLRAVPVDELVTAIPSGPAMGGDIAYRTLGIGPNVDGVVLPDTPDALIAAGAHAGVPYVMGTNRDEGTLFTDDAVITDAASYETWVRAMMGDLADVVLSVYPVESYETPLAAADSVFRDLGFVCPARDLAMALTAGGAEVARLWGRRAAHRPRRSAGDGEGAGPRALRRVTGRLIGSPNARRPTASDTSSNGPVSRRGRPARSSAGQELAISDCCARSSSWFCSSAARSAWAATTPGSFGSGASVVHPSSELNASKST